MVWFVHHIQKKEIYFALYGPTGIFTVYSHSRNGNGMGNVLPIPAGSNHSVVGNSDSTTASNASTVGAVVSPQSLDGHPAKKAKNNGKQRIKVLAKDIH